jgi:hypothetical protein
MLEQFTSDISFHKGNERLVRLRTNFVVGRMLMLTLLIAAPAVAQVPCPPQIDSSTSEECGANQIPQSDTPESDTPDYQDPLASCSALESRRVVPVATAAALQQALDTAGCGDTIELAAGTYSSTFSISKSCPATNPIIVRGAPNFQSTIRRSFAITGQHTIVTGINL